MRRAFLLFSFLIAACAVRADDEIRTVQQQLKDQGFFYGEVDGQTGAETTAAIRRYQIRNGLEVTGALNQETLSSMKITGGTRPASPAAPTAPEAPPDLQDKNTSVAQADREFLRQQAQPQPSAAPAPVRERYVGSVTPVAPPAPDFGTLYVRTPYESAPAEVQTQVLQMAQGRLSRYGYYRDAIDGLPGPSTQRALLLFQQNAGLVATGRLDMDTLAALRLLPPHRGLFAPRPETPYAAPLRGIWVH